MLGLEPKAPAALAVGEAEARAKKLREAGVVFHVDLVPDGKVVTAKARGVVNLEADDLAKAAEASTKSAIALSQRLGAVSARAELEKIRADLRAQAPATFRGEPQARREEITLELDASAAVLTEASDAGERWGGVAAKFALDLARALEASSAAGASDGPPGKPSKGEGAKPPPPVVVATRPPPPPPPSPARRRTRRPRRPRRSRPPLRLLRPSAGQAAAREEAQGRRRLRAVKRRARARCRRAQSRPGPCPKRVGPPILRRAAPLRRSRRDR